MLHKLFTPLDAIDAQYREIARSFSVSIVMIMQFMMVLVVLITAAATRNFRALYALVFLLPLCVITWYRIDSRPVCATEGSCSFLTVETSITMLFSVIATGATLHAYSAPYFGLAFPAVLYLLLLFAYNLRSSREPATYRSWRQAEIDDPIEF